MNRIVKRWIHDGMLCMIAMVSLDGVGYHYCGYVMVPEGHPIFGKHYDSHDVASLAVHGGVTFSDELLLDDMSLDTGWFVGFDCMHHMDSPHDALLPFMMGGHAWTMGEVQRETESLADQVAALDSRLASRAKRAVSRMCRRFGLEVSFDVDMRKIRANEIIRGYEA